LRTEIRALFKGATTLSRDCKNRANAFNIIMKFKQLELMSMALNQVCDELHRRFGIEHPTVQIESADQTCRLAPAHVV